MPRAMGKATRFRRTTNEGGGDEGVGAAAADAVVVVGDGAGKVALRCGAALPQVEWELLEPKPGEDNEGRLVITPVKDDSDALRVGVLAALPLLATEA
mmetsp:Transcript_108813/g.162768  ORF Transcript_108813/g.162768 Transcript_108813/m.162768 type:complete len:98 (+) Transcript_108813:806-1099(+)